MILKMYKNLFGNLRSAALITAVVLFILYFVLFLGICYAFTWMPTDDIFIIIFERYLILAKGIYMIVPFAVSTVLIFFLITEHLLCLLVWSKVYLGFATVYLMFFFAAGLYSCIEGSLSVGLPIVLSTLILTVLNGHCLALVYCLYLKALKEKNVAESLSESRSSTDDSM